MKNTARLSISVLALLTMAAATGCGRTALPTASAGVTRAAGAHVIQAAGKTRKLGYNVTRYQQVLSRRSHPQHVTVRGALPASTDNRNFCSPIADQGDLGSCTAFSMAKGMREYMQRHDNETIVPMSALWLYYEERVRMGTVGEDSGANMIDGVSVLADKGCATETTWPYITSKFTIEPPAAAYATAAEHKIKSFTEIASLDDVKASLAKGQPVVFGFMVYSSFQWIGKNGVMPMPKPNEGILGGHAVQAVGYDDAKKQLIVRNSWGSSWGDKGYFYMPYAYAADSEKAMEWYTAQ